MSIPIGSISDTSKPWEKWSSETDLAYSYFVAYLELGAVRTMEAVRKKYGKSSSYLRQLQKWSSQFKWVERCAAYDRHIVKKSLESKSDIIDHANALLLNMVEESIGELKTIIGLDIYDTVTLDGADEGTARKINPQIVAQKLRGVDMVLNKAGVVDKKEDDLPKKGDTTFNQYIQNIYNLIEEKKILDD